MSHVSALAAEEEEGTSRSPTPTPSLQSEIPPTPRIFLGSGNQPPFGKALTGKGRLKCCLSPLELFFLSFPSTFTSR